MRTCCRLSAAPSAPTGTIAAGTPSFPATRARSAIPSAGKVASWAPAMVRYRRIVPSGSGSTVKNPPESATASTSSTGGTTPANWPGTRTPFPAGASFPSVCTCTGAVSKKWSFETRACRSAPGASSAPRNMNPTVTLRARSIASASCSVGSTSTAASGCAPPAASQTSSRWRTAAGSRRPSRPERTRAATFAMRRPSSSCSDQITSKPTAAVPPAASRSTSRAIFARLQGQSPSSWTDFSSMPTITTRPDGDRGPRSRVSA